MSIKTRGTMHTMGRLQTAGLELKNNPSQENYGDQPRMQKPQRNLNNAGTTI